jgi:hypothetical protein
MLIADVRHDYVQTFLMDAAEIKPDVLTDLYENFED